MHKNNKLAQSRKFVEESDTRVSDFEKQSELQQNNFQHLTAAGMHYAKQRQHDERSTKVLASLVQFHQSISRISMLASLPPPIHHGTTDHDSTLKISEAEHTTSTANLVKTHHHAAEPHKQVIEPLIEIPAPLFESLGQHQSAAYFELLGPAVNAAKTVAHTNHNIEEDLAVGIPPLEAKICNTIGGLIQGGSELVMHHVLATSTVGALGGSATLIFEGVATGNPLATAAGVGSAGAIITQTGPAFDDAASLSYELGAEITNTCHGVFRKLQN